MASAAVTVVWPPRVTDSMTWKVPTGSVSPPAATLTLSRPSENPFWTPENWMVTVRAQAAPTATSSWSPLTLPLMLREASSAVTAEPLSSRVASFSPAPRQMLSVNPLYIPSPHCSIPSTQAPLMYCLPLAQE